MTVPAPPGRIDPEWETVPAGAVLYRVHEPQLPDGTPNDGAVFNPGFGRGRFHVFGTPAVPVLYAAGSPEGAVLETILHSKYPGDVVRESQWKTKVLTAVVVQQDLKLAAFHSTGLRRLGLYASMLTDTFPAEYAHTALWAQRAWEVGAEGVAYVSRQLNTSRAYCFFGDRVPLGAVRVLDQHAEARVFRHPDDREWLAHLAARMDVTLAGVGPAR